MGANIWHKSSTGQTKADKLLKFAWEHYLKTWGGVCLMFYLKFSFFLHKILHFTFNNLFQIDFALHQFWLSSFDLVFKISISVNFLFQLINSILIGLFHFKIFFFLDLRSSASELKPSVGIFCFEAHFGV